MMTKYFYTIFIFIFLSVSATAQKKQSGKYAFCQKVNKDYSIVFLKYDKAFKLYASPRILWQNKLIRIKDFDEDNFSGVNLNIAPNKRYIVLDNIIKGYVQTEKDSVLHENYTCVILDVKKAKIVMSMQTDCGGNWNKKNEWENDGKLLFKDGDFLALKK
jgi:hypothetical protein